MISGFLTALRFLTILPVKYLRDGKHDYHKSIMFFPVVGILIGLILTAAQQIFIIFNFLPFTISVLIAIILIFITGAIHLDGLADTLDGLYGGRKKEDVLRIMRDPHIGTMGVVGIVSILILKVSLLHSLGMPIKMQYLIAMCAISRAQGAFSMIIPYARSEGKAKVFTDGLDYKYIAIAMGIAFICSLAIGILSGIVVFLVSSAAVYLFNKFIQYKIGGITGDTLGAVIELSEVIILITICIINPVIWR